jgi:hypothetical protein
MRRARKLARSGQYSTHVEVLAELERAFNISDVAQLYTEAPFLTQLDLICTNAQR